MKIRFLIACILGVALLGHGAVSLAAGGPDAFGYTYRDTGDPDGPTYAFFDISGTGTSVALLDDASQNVPIGFTFSFYGGVYTTVDLSSNGYLTFGPDGTDFSNDCPLVPGGQTPTYSIFAYWDDLDPGDDGALAYYENFGACPVGSGTGCTIFQWEEFDFFQGDGNPGGTAGTFQAILYDTHEILIQYEGGPGLDGASATVGIWQNDLGNSLLYSCNESVISSELAIEFVAGPVDLVPVPTLSQVGIAVFAGLLLLLALVRLRRSSALP